MDERSEIASCFKGVPQYEIGLRTDVLDACPKRLGMIIAVRSLSPQVVITDEIGRRGDREAVGSVLNAGVKIITSAHGYNLSSLESRREVLEMMKQSFFERYIVLSSKHGPGTLEEVFEGRSKKIIYRREDNAD